MGRVRTEGKLPGALTPSGHCPVTYFRHVHRSTTLFGFFRRVASLVILQLRIGVIVT